jgi:hypothetical protein
MQCASTITRSIAAQMFISWYDQFVPTRKVTISVDVDELAWIEQRAKRLHAGNVSAAFVDGLQALRRRESLEDFLRLSKAPRLSADEVAAVMAEIRGADTSSTKARRRRRTA